MAESSHPNPNPSMSSYEDEAKPWQHWTLSYLNPLLRLGAQKVLDFDDCGAPSHEDSADVVHAKVIQAWDAEVERARLANIALAECISRRSNGERGEGGGKRLWGYFGRIFWRRHSGADATATAAHTNQGAVDDVGEKSSSTILTPEGDSLQQQLGPESTRPNEPKVINPSLSRALLKSFGPWRIVYAIVLISVSSVLSFVPILLLNDLVRYAESVNNSDAIDAGNAPSYKGIANPWIEVAGLFFVPLFASILQTRHMVIMQHAAVFARTGCSTMLFQKALRVSPTGRSRTDVGLVVNMMSNDTTVIMKFIQLSGMTAVTPLQIGISLALIHRQVGTVSTWVGVAFLVLLLPFNGVVFSTVARLRRRVLKFQDARVKMTNDVLAGIRIVKFYAWERPFGEEIEAVREEELRALTSLTLVMLVGFSAILFAAPIVQIMLVFATFTLTQEEPLSASVAFTTVALFVSTVLR